MVCRADLAVDLRFEDRAVGVDLLRALAALPLPRWKTRTWGHPLRPETVEYWAGRQVALCAYDRGLRTKTGEPGAWIRVERRLRYTGRARPTIEAFAESASSADWLGQLAGWTESDGPIRLCGLDAARRHAFETEEAGRVSRPAVNRMLANLARIEGGKPSTSAERARFRKDCYQIGLVVGPGWLQSQTLPLGPIIRGAARVWDELETEE
jgi:hypothetical protein